jgi:Tol biopolymer transport system component
MRKSSMLLVGGIAMVGLVAPGPVPAAATTVTAAAVGANGEIAFASLTGGDSYDIFVMNADGTEATNVTNTPDVSESDPNWSPDGLHIAYTRSTPTGDGNSDIWVMNGDGTDQTALTANDDTEFQPDWSPDGTQVVYVRQTAGVVISTQFDIWVTNADGSNQHAVTTGDTDELDPAWSPDGDRLVFAGVRPSPGEEWYRWELVTADTDGANETLVTTANDMPDGNSYEDRAPGWSPDGEMIVWMAQYDESCCGDWDIWAMNEDGSGKTNLTDDGDFWLGSGDGFPTWSPDGTTISFTSNRTDGWSSDIYVIDAPTQLPPPTSTFSIAHRSAPTLDDGARLLADTNARALDWSAVAVDAARLRTVRRGTGTGTIVSVDRGIVCGDNCTQLYPTGTVVALRARPAAGSVFVGWRGACTGTLPTCKVTMTAASSVAAAFRAVPAG